jgi:glucose-1-phosphate adenylyltransferase
MVGDGVEMNGIVMMGSDYCDPDDFAPLGGIPLGIGNGSHIEGAILDKNVRISRDVQTHRFPRGVDLETANWVECDGIVLIPKNTALPDGTRIGPT